MCNMHTSNENESKWEGKMNEESKKTKKTLTTVKRNGSVDFNSWYGLIDLFIRNYKKNLYRISAIVAINPTRMNSYSRFGRLLSVGRIYTVYCLVCCSEVLSIRSAINAKLMQILSFVCIVHLSTSEKCATNGLSCEINTLHTWCTVELTLTGVFENVTDKSIGWLSAKWPWISTETICIVRNGIFNCKFQKSHQMHIQGQGAMRKKRKENHKHNYLFFVVYWIHCFISFPIEQLETVAVSDPNSIRA